MANNIEGSLDGPLKCLRPATLHRLSQSLNPRKVLPSPEGHLRDWRGIAELMGFDAQAIKNFEDSGNPFVAMLYENATANISDLRNCLELIDRYDTLDDCNVLLEQDLVAYNDRIRQTTTAATETLRTSSTLDDLSTLARNLVEYDAFVLFAEQDKAFAEQVIEKMEKQYNLRLCVRDRDLLAGLPFEHRAVTDLIENRCRFVLPIFSPAFLQSEENKFVVAFAEALGIDKGCRKIVPCLYQPCVLPKTLSYYSRLDFTRANAHFNFWEKMYRSLATPPGVPGANQQPGLLNDVTGRAADTKTGTRDVTVATKTRPLTNDVTLKTCESDSALMDLEKNGGVRDTAAGSSSSSSRSWLKKIISKPKKNKSKKLAAAVAS